MVCTVGVQRDLVIVAVGSVIAVAAVAARGSGSRAVHDDGDQRRGFAVGNRNGGGAGAHGGDHAAGAHGGHTAVAGLVGEALGGRSRGGLGRQGAGGTRLEHHIGGVTVMT